MEDNTDRYAQFLQWFHANGGKSRDILFPTVFPPTDYIGISAVRPIPRNTVILAVPKTLIIGIAKVVSSEIGFLLPQYGLFQGEDNDDKDFNILTLFIIFEKMKGRQSFYFPYLQCIDIAETLIHWKDQEIQALQDPFIDINFVNEIRAEFTSTYNTFQKIVNSNRHLFKQELTIELFDLCYGNVLTRCYGWGFPETMLVPFADFFNHHSNNQVNSYTFSITLEGKVNLDYVMKARELDLKIFGVDNSKLLPVGYQKDSREEFIKENLNILSKYGKQIGRNVRKLPKKQFKECLQIVRQEKVLSNYQQRLYLSSDEEDNGTNSDLSDDEDPQEKQWGIYITGFLHRKKFFRQIFSFIYSRCEEPYSQPKPLVNQENKPQVKFDWWFEQNDSYFIMATAKQTEAGQEISNSYRRRSNRFLIRWYGFAIEDNKYDSVSFRIFHESIKKKLGQTLFTRYLSEIDWKNQIPMQDKNYPHIFLSPQFRLKATHLNYYLIAFLRYQVIQNNIQYLSWRDRLQNIYQILDLSVETEAMERYLSLLKELVRRYSLVHERNFNFIKDYRRHIATIVVKSNSNILQRHLRVISELLILLKDLIRLRSPAEQLQMLQTWYGNPWKDESSIKQCAANRIFVRQYCHFLKCYIIE